MYGFACGSLARGLVGAGSDGSSFSSPPNLPQSTCLYARWESRASRAEITGGAEVIA